MIPQRHRRLQPLLVLTLILGTSFGGSRSILAQGETPTEEVHPGAGFYDDARELYRQQRYSEAGDYLRMAIQLEPLGDPRYYIGLARACFYAEDYDQAVYYYDLYLQTFPAHAAEARRRADRTEAIQSERDEANRHRAHPDQPPTLLSEQFAAYQALQQRIEAGIFLTPEHSGAYTMFQTLMRTRYANPDIASLRERIIEGLLEEAQRQFWPTADSPVPVTTMEEWRLVYERYRLAEELGRPVMEQPEVQARILAAQGQIDLINTNFEAALQRFGEAVALDPNLLAVQWGRFYAAHKLAYLQGITPDPTLLQSVADLRALTELQAPQHLSLVDVVKAMILSDLGRNEEAAVVLIGILAPEHGTPRALEDPVIEEVSPSPSTEPEASTAAPLLPGDPAIEPHVASPPLGESPEVPVSPPPPTQP